MNIQRRPGALTTIRIIKNLIEILKDKLEIFQKIKQKIQRWKIKEKTFY